MQTMMEPVQLPVQYIVPDATPFLDALLDADGQVPLAAERMHITRAEFVRAIARDPEAVSKIHATLRVYTTMKLFESVGQTQLVMSAKLPDLEPFEATRAFTGFADLIERLTRDNTSEVNVNVFDAARRKLPKEVWQAIETLANETQEQAQLTFDGTVTDDD